MTMLLKIHCIAWLLQRWIEIWVNLQIPRWIQQPIVKAKAKFIALGLHKILSENVSILYFVAISTMCACNILSILYLLLLSFLLFTILCYCALCWLNCIWMSQSRRALSDSLIDPREEVRSGRGEEREVKEGLLLARLTGQIYALVADVGPSFVRPVIISRKLSKIGL